MTKAVVAGGGNKVMAVNPHGDRHIAKSAGPRAGQRVEIMALFSAVTGRQPQAGGDVHFGGGSGAVIKLVHKSPRRLHS